MKAICEISGVSGAMKGAYGQGGVIAIVATIMVFIVLFVIIILTEAIGSAVNKAVPLSANETPVNKTSVRSALNLNDEDATIAALVASIDYRNEIKKNIKVVSIREVK